MLNCFVLLHIIKDAVQKESNSWYFQFHKLAAGIQEKQNIKAQVQFRHDLLESQKRINYQNEFDRLQGANNYQD